MDVVEIIVGTYEEYILGYKMKFDDTCQFEHTFANHSHSSSVRSVTSNGEFLLSGGADNNIYVYNLLTRKESALLPQNATVSCIAFTPNQSHVVVGRGDGSLSLFRVGNYVLEKTWGSAHKKSGVVGISVHPSGKIALTVGNDGILKTWNLVKGRLAYAKALPSKKHYEGYQISGVLWSPSGEFYAVGIGSKVDVYSVKTAGVVCTVSPSVKICCFHFVNDTQVAIGCENGNIAIFDIAKQEIGELVEAHERRVKCISCFMNGTLNCLVSASSSGDVKVWKIKNLEVEEWSKVNTGCRITSLTVATYREKAGVDGKKNETNNVSDSESKCDSIVDSKSDSDSEHTNQEKKRKLNSSEDLESSNYELDKKKKKKKKKKMKLNKVSQFDGVK